MLKQPYIEPDLLLFHAILRHLLVNATRGRGFNEKTAKRGMGERGFKKCHFVSDILFEWLNNYFLKKKL